MTREEYLRRVAEELYVAGYRAGDREDLKKDYMLTPYEFDVIINYLIERED